MEQMPKVVKNREYNLTHDYVKSYRDHWKANPKTVLPSLAIALADAYLALIHADDGEPLTEAWADTLNRKQVVEGDNVWVIGIGDVGNAVVLSHRVNEFGNWWALYMGGNKLQMMVTRGDVRCGCKFLGIPLKEQP